MPYQAKERNIPAYIILLPEFPVKKHTFIKYSDMRSLEMQLVHARQDSDW